MIRDCTNERCAFCGHYMPEDDRWCSRPSFCQDQYGAWGYVNVHSKCADARDRLIKEYFEQGGT